MRLPQVEVQLSGEDGNIFAIVGAVRRAMRRAEVPQETILEFSNEVASQKSYDDALQTVMRWVHVT